MGPQGLASLDGRASVELDVATRVVATGVPTNDGTIRCVMAGCGGQSSEKLSSRGVGRAITLTGTPPPDATDESLPNRPQTTFPSGPPDSVRARPPDHEVRIRLPRRGSASRGADNADKNSCT